MSPIAAVVPELLFSRAERTKADLFPQTGKILEIGVEIHAGDG
jgi:hypothetical protein